MTAHPPGARARARDRWDTGGRVYERCKEPGCENASQRRGWCGMHYQRWYRYGSPRVTKIDRHPPATCSVDGCDRLHRSKGLCFMHWQRQHATGELGLAEPMARRYGPDDQCEADECASRPRWGGLCDFHSDRKRRGVDLGLPPLKAPNGSGHHRPDGYIVDRLPAHPLANRKGEVLRHRVVLFDSIGPGVHPCHWCSTPVEWTALGLVAGALVVDHVDWDTSNNERGNLVPSCHPCNSERRAP